MCHHDQTPEKKNIKEDLVWLLVIEILTHGGVWRSRAVHTTEARKQRKGDRGRMRASKGISLVTQHLLPPPNYAVILSIRD